MPSPSRRAFWEPMQSAGYRIHTVAQAGGGDGTYHAGQSPRASSSTVGRYGEVHLGTSNSSSRSVVLDHNIDCSPAYMKDRLAIRRRRGGSAYLQDRLAILRRRAGSWRWLLSAHMKDRLAIRRRQMASRTCGIDSLSCSGHQGDSDSGFAGGYARRLWATVTGLLHRSPIFEHCAKSSNDQVAIHG